MAKRFTDTNKYKKTFFRGLPGAYKLFWDFLYHECDNAGIWHVDMDIAQIYIGKDMLVSLETALRVFNEGEERVKVLENGRKWFIIPFIHFQYGSLTPVNNMHRPIISTLLKLGLRTPSEGPPLAPIVGAMDKDKSKEGVVVKGSVRGAEPNPTPQEVEAYAKTLNFELDGEAFIAHYEKVGWVDKNGNKIKNWKPCVVTWKKYRNLNQKNQQVDFA